MFISSKQPDDLYSNDVYQKGTVTSEFNREHIYTQTTDSPLLVGILNDLPHCKCTICF